MTGNNSGAFLDTCLLEAYDYISIFAIRKEDGTKV